MKHRLLILILSGIFLLPVNTFSQLIWSTFCSYNFLDYMKIDDSGYVYFSGETTFHAYPCTPGAYCAFNKGLNDVIVTKMNQTGSELIFSTYIGGIDGEMPNGMILDSNHNICLFGGTNSYDYPVTSGAYDTLFTDPCCVITKLNNTGTNLIFSTFLKGANYSGGIDIDKVGNLYITGLSFSNNFPTTAGAYNTNGEGFFIAKFNNIGSKLFYSTFITSGDSDLYEYQPWIVVDTAGNAFISGWTYFNNFPVTPISFNPYKSQGITNFVLKLNTNGDSLLFSTFIGEVENPNQIVSLPRITIDNLGSSYITGLTTGFYSYYPITPGAYDSLRIGEEDIFITKLNNSGSNIIFSTFIGSSGYDLSDCIIIDKKYNIYITGKCKINDTAGIGFPVTSNAFMKNYIWENDMGLITVFDSEGNKLLYSSYFANSTMSMAEDKYNSIYLAGNTYTTNFPITTNAYDTSRAMMPGQDYKIFLSKLKICEPNIQAINKIDFPGNGCYSKFQDTFYLKNTSLCTLQLDSTILRGNDSSLFTIYTEHLPLLVLQDDSTRIIINFNHGDSTGARTAALYIYNNSPISPYIINLSANYDTIAFKVNNIDSDTIEIDLGNFCPGSTKDTTITIFNKSSKGSTINISNPAPPFQVNGTDKAESGKGDKPEAVEKKKK